MGKFVLHFQTQGENGKRQILCARGNARQSTADPVAVTCPACLRILHREALAHVDRATAHDTA